MRVFLEIDLSLTNQVHINRPKKTKKARYTWPTVRVFAAKD